MRYVDARLFNMLYGDVLFLRAAGGQDALTYDQVHCNRWNANVLKSACGGDAAPRAFPLLKSIPIVPGAECT